MIFFEFLSSVFSGSNMLLDGENNIKLADLGISKECHHSTYESKRTQGCGTTHYMAPEVMAGEQYGRKADIWSVCFSLFYKCLR